MHRVVLGIVILMLLVSGTIIVFLRIPAHQPPTRDAVEGTITKVEGKFPTYLQTHPGQVPEKNEDLELLVSVSAPEGDYILNVQNVLDCECDCAGGVGIKDSYYQLVPGAMVIFPRKRRSNDLFAQSNRGVLTIDEITAMSAPHTLDVNPPSVGQ